MRGSRRTLAQYNRLFYERCWRAGSVQRLPGVDAPGAGLPVEIGCGLRPRLPLDAGVFVDFSRTACAKLRRAGASAALCADVLALPFRTGSLTTLHAYEVLEHVANDRAAVRELARVLAPDGSLIVNLTVRGSTASTLLTAAKRSLTRLTDSGAPNGVMRSANFASSISVAPPRKLE